MKITIELTRPSWLHRPRSRKGLTILLALVLTLGVPAGALATHTFADVPTSSAFHDAISAIAGAGITNGCGPSLYCPSANVTREQMAMFMYRGLGRATYADLEFVDVVPAAEVPALWTFPITSGLPTGALAGASGYIRADASITITVNNATGCPCKYRGTLYVSGEGYMHEMVTDVTISGANSTSGTLSMVGLKSVIVPGTKTIEVRLYRLSGTGAAYAWGNATATYFPFSGNP